MRRGPTSLTTPARTLLDLGCFLEPCRLEDVLDAALQRRIVTRAQLERLIGSARHGVAGVGTLRRLVAERSGGHAGESAFENRLRRVLVSNGLPRPVPQYVVHDRAGRFIARVDLAYPEARLAIEADGFAFHSGRRAFERDRGRQNSLVNAGWRVLRVTSMQLDRDASAVVGVVAEALAFPSVNRR